MNVLVRVYGWLKFVLMFLWLLFLLLVGAKIAQQNPQLVQLDVVFWVTPEISLGFLVSVILLLGVVLGIAAMLPSWMLARARVRRMRGDKLKARKHEQLSHQPAVRSQSLS